MTAPRVIRILGAGPSGLTAAINLARGGLEVHVHEKRANCGMRFSGDLQGVENWSTKEDALAEIRRYGIEPDFQVHHAADIDMVGGSVTVGIRLPNVGWYLVERGAAPHSLDQRLRAQAEQAGVHLHFESTLPPEEADIIATGPRKSDIVAVGKGIVFKTSAPDMSVMLLGHTAARTGYSYLLITGGHGVMCCGIFDAFDQLHACWEESVEKLHAKYDFDVQNPKPFGGVEGFSLQPTFQEGRALRIGEAAGVQDLLWGFGIRTAVRSGWLAARSILEDRPFQELADEHIVPGMRAGAVARWLWETASVQDYDWALRLLAAQPNQVAFIRALYAWTPLHRILYPWAKRALARRYAHFLPGT